MKRAKPLHFSLLALVCCVIATCLIIFVTSDTLAGGVSLYCSTSITDDSSSGSRLAKASASASHGWSLNAHPHSGRLDASTRVGTSVDADADVFRWASYYLFGASASASCDSIGSTGDSASASASGSESGGSSCSSSKSK